MSPRSWSDAAAQPAHRSFFRRSIQERARIAAPGTDPVHEYLVDQANLRGFLGAYSDREDRGSVDEALTLEDIVVGLLQPQAPVEGRILKLVVRMLQSGRLDATRLVFRARRELALGNLVWLLDLIPEVERNEPVESLRAAVARTPPRGARRPNVDYDARRLIKRPGRG